MTRALVVVGMMTLLGACANQDNYIWWSDITSITGNGVANHQATIGLGQTLQLTAWPTDAAVEWTSSNVEVATVSENGLVTAVSLGEATITAYPKDKEGLANGNYVVVTVKDMSIPYVDDKIDQSEAE